MKLLLMIFIYGVITSFIAVPYKKIDSACLFGLALSNNLTENGHFVQIWIFAMYWDLVQLHQYDNSYQMNPL